MITLAFILVVAVLHFLRGRDLPVVNKVLTSALIGAAFGAYCYESGQNLYTSAIASVITFVGILLWVGPGWGKYFAAFHGRYSLREKEFFPADLIADTVYGKTNDPYLSGAIGMTIRAITGYPLFVALAAWLFDPLNILIGIGVLMQGPIYAVMRYIPERFALYAAEAITGLLMGTLLSFCI